MSVNGGSPRYQRVLIFFVGLIGDSLVSIPALRAIRRAVGSACIVDLLHEHYVRLPISSADIFGPLSLINNAISYCVDDGLLKKLGGAFSALMKIRRARYDAVFYLMPSQRDSVSVRRDRIFFHLAGVRVQYGFKTFSPQELVPRLADGSPARVEHESLMYLRRFAETGFPVAPDSAGWALVPPSDASVFADQWLQSARKYPSRRLVAIGVATKQPSKNWPLERLEQVGKHLVERGDCELVVVGGLPDLLAARRLVSKWGAGLVAAGQFNLMQSAALLRQCDLLIGLDTGTSHLAAAVGTRCVAIYSGHNWPGRWDPLGTGHFILREPVPCAGCLKRVCPIPAHPCINGILAVRVIAAVDTALSVPRNERFFRAVN